MRKATRIFTLTSWAGVFLSMLLGIWMVEPGSDAAITLIKVLCTFVLLGMIGLVLIAITH